MSRLLPMVLIGALAAGCAHRVSVVSDPIGAEVRYDGDRVGVTPVEFKVRWSPFERRRAEVRLKGYRSVPLRLQRGVGPVHLLRDAIAVHLRGLGPVAPRDRYEVVLLREHGNAGTWSPEDAARR